MNKSSLEAWKAQAQASEYVRPGEIVEFSEPNSEGIIYASIPHGHMPISLGVYFTRASREVSAGSCWNH